VNCRTCVETKEKIKRLRLWCPWRNLVKTAFVRRPKRKFVDNVKMNFKKINCDDSGGGGLLAQDNIDWPALALVMLSCWFLLPHC
jgi:hypothetical protein